MEKTVRKLGQAGLSEGELLQYSQPAKEHTMKAVVNLIHKAHQIILEKTDFIGRMLSNYVPGSTLRYEECIATNLVVSVTNQTTSDALNVVVKNLPLTQAIFDASIIASFVVSTTAIMVNYVGQFDFYLANFSWVANLEVVTGTYMPGIVKALLQSL